MRRLRAAGCQVRTHSVCLVSETEPSPARFRDALAAFPTGVTVVTALGPNGPSGATANAVTSLSLEPPMMLACLDRGSRTLETVRSSGRYGVNVLAADREDLAHRFSTKEHPTVKWDGVEWSERAGVPWIEATVAVAACELADLHEGGDHVIATGAVVELEAQGGDPLAFWGGAYHGLHLGR
jgi:4-nitrophenol 2-monooxygenase / 4-nitrocatechol 4-monooxygenase, reductase component